jgi:transcriptional regulator with XRE-family HTH domain
MRKDVNSKISNGNEALITTMNLDSDDEKSMLPDLSRDNLRIRRGSVNRALKEESLGQRIRAARTRKNMTQEELAEAMLTTKSMISYYENDHGDMKQSMIAEFADILGTTVEYLICGVIKAPELDTDSVEMLKLFGAMDEKTRQIMLVQMRAVARF